MREPSTTEEDKSGSGESERPVATATVPPEEQAGERARPALLDQIEVPVASASAVLTSGRRYEMRTDRDVDRLTVRSRNGRVLLCVLMTENGPVLSFEGADIEIAGAKRLALSAKDISIEARGSLQMQVGGDCFQRIAGTRHTRVDGAERLEAGSIEIQANDAMLGLRAAGRIALDGEHIGLNDDPCPQPFAWTSIAGAPEETCTRPLDRTE